MPTWIQLAIAFFYGSVIGSFSCVVRCRLPAIMARRPVRLLAELSYPPSTCPHCQHRIRWYENIPVFSYLVLRGKCSLCSSGIPLNHLITEIAFGLALVVIWLTVL